MISFSNFFIVVFIRIVGIIIVKGIWYWFEINWKKLLVGGGGGGVLGKVKYIYFLEYVVGYLIGF